MYRERAQRPASRFEFRPAPGYGVVSSAALVAGVFIGGVWRGAAAQGLLLPGLCDLAVGAIFWFSTAAYRVRGTLVLDDEQLSLVDARGRMRWQLPAREVSFSLTGGVVVLKSPRGTQRLPTRVFRDEADIDRLSRELVERAAGKSVLATFEGIFADFFARNGAPRSPSSPADAQLDARVDEELRKLD